MRFIASQTVFNQAESLLTVFKQAGSLLTVFGAGSFLTVFGAGSLLVLYCVACGEPPGTVLCSMRVASSLLLLYVQVSSSLPLLYVQGVLSLVFPEVRDGVSTPRGVTY